MEKMAENENHNTIEKQPLESLDTEVRSKRRCAYYHNHQKYLVILAIIASTLAGFLFGYFIHRAKVSSRKHRITPHEEYQSMVDTDRLEALLR